MKKRLLSLWLGIVLAAGALLTVVAPVAATYPYTSSCDSYLFVLYQDDDFGGPQFDNWLSGNTCDLRDDALSSTNAGNWNDRADSIRIFALPANRTLYLCKDINYGGGCLQFEGPATPSSPLGLRKLNFGGWHDAISSFRILS